MCACVQFESHTIKKTNLHLCLSGIALLNSWFFADKKARASGVHAIHQHFHYPSHTTISPHSRCRRRAALCSCTAWSCAMQFVYPKNATQPLMSSAISDRPPLTVLLVGFLLTKYAPSGAPRRWWYMISIQTNCSTQNKILRFFYYGCRIDEDVG